VTIAKRPFERARDNESGYSCFYRAVKPYFGKSEIELTVAKTPGIAGSAGAL
jgi:hypothetical protein